MWVQIRPVSCEFGERAPTSNVIDDLTHHFSYWQGRFEVNVKSKHILISLGHTHFQLIVFLNLVIDLSFV
jgi:hypothetical protein